MPNGGKNYGKIYSNEERQTFSLSNKEFFETEEGKILKEKLSLLGRKRLVNGKRVLSPEAREKMRKSAERTNKIRWQK